MAGLFTPTNSGYFPADQRDYVAKITIKNGVFELRNGKQKHVDDFLLSIIMKRMDIFDEIESWSGTVEEVESKCFREFLVDIVLESKQFMYDDNNDEVCTAENFLSTLEYYLKKPAKVVIKKLMVEKKVDKNDLEAIQKVVLDRYSKRHNALSCFTEYKRKKTEHLSMFIDRLMVLGTWAYPHLDQYVKEMKIKSMLAKNCNDDDLQHIVNIFNYVPERISWELYRSEILILGHLFGIVDEAKECSQCKKLGHLAERCGKPGRFDNVRKFRSIINPELHFLMGNTDNNNYNIEKEFDFVANMTIKNDKFELCNGNQKRVNKFLNEIESDCELEIRKLKAWSGKESDDYCVREFLANIDLISKSYDVEGKCKSNILLNEYLKEPAKLIIEKLIKQHNIDYEDYDSIRKLLLDKYARHNALCCYLEYKRKANEHLALFLDRLMILATMAFPQLDEKEKEKRVKHMLTKNCNDDELHHILNIFQAVRSISWQDYRKQIILLAHLFGIVEKAKECGKCKKLGHLAERCGKAGRYDKIMEFHCIVDPVLMRKK